MFHSFDKILTDLEILLIKLIIQNIICSAKFNFSSVVMPNYFTDGNWTIVEKYLDRWDRIGDFGGNIDTEDFSGLTIVLLALALLVHSSKLSNS